LLFKTDFGLKTRLGWRNVLTKVSAPLSRRFATAWQALRDLGAVLRPCRFSVFVIAAGGAILLLTAQGQELAVRLPDEPASWHRSAFHLCVFLWAFESWYWARILLTFAFSPDRRHDLQGKPLPLRTAFFVLHVPRVLGAGAYIIAGTALWFAGDWGDFAVSAAIGVCFYWGLVKRMKIAQTLRLMRSGDTVGRAVRWLGSANAQPASLRDLPLLSRTVLAASVALAVVCTAAVVADAVAFGWAMGAAAVPFLGLALIVPVGSLAVYWAHVGGPQTPDVRGNPVVTLLLLWALAGSVVFDLFADNHVLRVANDPLLSQRPQLATAAARWHDAAAHASGSQEPPLVIVATAGGGLRAAYWTATVMGALQDADPNFRTYVFGISGVSGGSLGATVFVTLLADGSTSVESSGQAILSNDFLAPPAAGLLFPDLIQRFVPVFPSGSDRAAALERSWERAWGRAGFRQDAWAGRGFVSLWNSEAAGVPALLLNGTHVESGKRIITSNLRIDQNIFKDTYDVFDDIVHTDIPVSTAVLNSARFPYVTPAGTLRERNAGERRGHIVDGGYYENFGAITALELLRAVRRELERGDRKARPLLIQISSDPDLKRDDLDLDGARLSSRASNWWGNEALSPLRAMLQTRSGRGTAAYKEFLLAQPDQARRVHFRLCTVAGERPPALGWVLSDASERQMRELIRNDTCDNRKAFEKVLAAIKP